MFKKFKGIRFQDSALDYMGHNPPPPNLNCLLDAFEKIRDGFFNLKTIISQQGNLYRTRACGHLIICSYQSKLDIIVIIEIYQLP